MSDRIISTQGEYFATEKTLRVTVTVTEIQDVDEAGRAMAWLQSQLCGEEIRSN